MSLIPDPGSPKSTTSQGHRPNQPTKLSWYVRVAPALYVLCRAPAQSIFDM